MLTAETRFGDVIAFLDNFDCKARRIMTYSKGHPANLGIAVRFYGDRGGIGSKVYHYNSSEAFNLGALVIVRVNNRRKIVKVIGPCDTRLATKSIEGVIVEK